MFTRILTAEEREEIQQWMRADGAKETHIRTIAARGKKFMPQLKRDLALLEGFVAAYDKN